MEIWLKIILGENYFDKQELKSKALVIADIVKSYCAGKIDNLWNLIGLLRYISTWKHKYFCK